MTSVRDLLRDADPLRHEPPPLDAVCARLGSVAATFALEHLGGTSHAYNWAEFSARYEKHFGALKIRP